MLKPNSFNLRRKIFLLAVLIGCLALVSPTKIERRVLADNNFFPTMDYCDVIYLGPILRLSEQLSLRTLSDTRIRGLYRMFELQGRSPVGAARLLR